MKIHTTSIWLLVAMIVGVFVVTSCSTVNELSEYKFGGTTVAGTMRTPPEPEIDGNYNVRIDANNPVLTFASVATNLAKANQIEKVEAKMMGALWQVDVPQLVWEETYTRCTRSLASEPVKSVGDSDYIFDLEIRRYGLEADSANAAVKIEIATTARLYATADRRLIWQRYISVRDPLSPEVFGAGTVVDTVITTAALAGLTEEQLAEGFRGAARTVAYKIAKELEDDIYAAVFAH
jgi:hypothetical protein